MEISIFSFLAATIWSSVFIIFLYIGRKKRFFIKSFGVSSIVLLYGFSAVRLLFPVELPFTATVSSDAPLYQGIQKILYYPIGTDESYFPLWKVLAIVWIAFSLFLICVTVADYVGIMRDIDSVNLTEDGRIRNVLDRVQKENKGRFKVHIIQSAAIDGAMSTGVKNRYILLPDTASSSEEDLYYIVSHEYTHLKNRDQLVKLLSIIFCDIFWWNPLCYLLINDLEQSLEIKCDDMVVNSCCSAKEKSSYMKTIVKDVQRQKTRKHRKRLFGLRGTSGSAQIKERFMRIKIPHTKNQNNKLMVGMIVCVMLFSYSFVIQSAFDVPVEEVEVDSGTQAYEDDDVFIRVNKNGEYEFVSSNGISIVTETLAKEFIKNGTKLIETE